MKTTKEKPKSKVKIKKAEPGIKKLTEPEVKPILKKPTILRSGFQKNLPDLNHNKK